MKPPCFGSPARCTACMGCGVRVKCYEKQSAHAVCLLPKSRPVKRTPVKKGLSSVKTTAKKREKVDNVSKTKGTK